MAGLQSAGVFQIDEAGFPVQQHRSFAGVEPEGARRIANAELQDFYPEGFGGGKVAPFVDNHQHHQHGYKGAYSDESRFHLTVPY